MGKAVGPCRARLWCVSAALIVSGCSSSPYAEVTHRKPHLVGPAGAEPLASVERGFTRAIHEERSKPLVALGDCLAALKSASDELKRNRKNAVAVRDYNFGISRIFQIIHDAKL